MEAMAGCDRLVLGLQANVGGASKDSNCNSLSGAMTFLSFVINIFCPFASE